MTYRYDITFHIKDNISIIVYNILAVDELDAIGKAYKQLHVLDIKFDIKLMEVQLYKNIRYNTNINPV
jgi:hypothetical protein